MKAVFWISLCTLLFLSTVAGCQAPDDAAVSQATTAIAPPAAPPRPRVNPEGMTLQDRFPVPEGYRRLQADSLSFAQYLRSLPLKPDGEPVHYYDGRSKSAYGVYLAVVDMEIGNRDLQQCADAVMRLRGEYLFAQKRYQEIHFNFLSDGKPRYYLDKADASRSYKSFRSYMNYIFSYANTGSLHDELVAVNNPDSIQPGDVFIVKRQPYGHAVTVVDVAVHTQSGKRIFMLSQSYMPAQETQILINPSDSQLSPWYEVKKGQDLVTPEWLFEFADLRRFSGE